MKRPEERGSLWIGKNKQFIHGPRFQAPKGRIFIRKDIPGYPRYKMQVNGSGNATIQSIIRPIYPGELPWLMKHSTYDGYEYRLNFNINPFVTIEGQRYTFYSFAINKRILDKFLYHIREKYHYRIKPLKINNIIIKRIYRRPKKT